MSQLPSIRNEMFRAEYLCQNPELLTHKSNPSAEITAYDGTFGSVVNKGNHFVVTPYVDIVYEPNLGMQSLQLHQNGSYGALDYVLWPQPFVPSLCHLACIPRPMSQGYDPVLWWTPDPQDLLSENHTQSGLGRLSAAKFRPLQSAISDFSKRTSTFKFASAHRNGTELEMAKNLSSNISRLLQRVQSLITTFPQMQNTVKTLQRLYLELVALIDYCQIYRPVINGSSTARSPNTKLIGAFVESTLHAEWLFKAGIPFWWIRPVSDLPRIRVDEIVPIFPVSECNGDSVSPIKPVWSGNIDTVQVHHAILMASGCFGEAENVRRQGQPTALTTSDNRTSINYQVGSGNKRKRSSNQPSNQEKFVRLDNRFMPPLNKFWRARLQSINCQQTVMKKRGGYLFPEAAILVSPTKLEKVEVYVRSWLRIRPSLIRLRSMSTTSDDFVSNQDWRDLLSLPLSQPGTTSSASAARTKLLAQLSMTEEDLRRDISAPGGEIVWRGTQLASPLLSDARLVQEVTWELNELNFRHEILTLDAELNGTSVANIPDVKKCFHSTVVPDGLSSIAVDKAHTGLGAVSARGRAPRLFALRDLMLTWNGVQRGYLLPHVYKSTDTGYEQLEIAVATTYLNMFYKIFGRGATVPHYLDVAVGDMEEEDEV